MNRRRDPDDPSARWREARAKLAELLRPYVQAHLVDDLVHDYVDLFLQVEGFKPPLYPVPEPIRRGRETRARAARHHNRPAQEDPWTP